jgi:hypothetical protein
MLSGDLVLAQVESGSGAIRDIGRIGAEGGVLRVNNEDALIYIAQGTHSRTYGPLLRWWQEDLHAQRNVLEPRTDGDWVVLQQEELYNLVWNEVDVLLAHGTLENLQNLIAGQS